MTFSILNTTTNKIISRHNVRPTGEHSSPNLRTDPLTTRNVVKSRHLHSDHPKDKEEPHTAIEEASTNASTSSPKKTIPEVDPNHLVGRTFLIPQEDV